MKSILNRRMLWVLILLPVCLLASVDQEVLVLFESDVVQMPARKTQASLSEVIAPQEVINCLQEIAVQEIIKVVHNFNRADTMIITEDGAIARLPDFSQLFLLMLTPGTDRDSAIFKLTALNEIINAEKNQRIYPLVTQPNDGGFNQQWNLNEPTGQLGINVMKAWDLSRGSNSVKIGIIDSGVDSFHTDLNGKVYGVRPSGFPDDNTMHGTHVAGIAGAIANNNSGIAGVDWNALIYSPVRIDYTWQGALDQAIQGVYNAVTEGCRIINCSWAFPDFSQNLYSTLLWAYQVNVLPVAANAASYNQNNYPNSMGSWICVVAATMKGDASNWNPRCSYTMERHYVDVAAPGGDGLSQTDWILSTRYYNYSWPYGGTFFWRGTSMAAPHVTGLAGLLLGANSGLKNYELEWIMKLSANDVVPPTGIDDYTGYGIVDAYEAVHHAILPFEFLRDNVPLYVYEPVYRHFTSEILPYNEPAGYYKCKMVVADIYLPPYSFDFIETPWGFLSLTGFSPDEPNDGRYWMRQDLSTGSAHFTTCFYYLYDRWVDGVFPHWTAVNKWVPVDPSVVAMRYTIIGRKSIIAPSNLQATAQPNSRNIKLTWNDNSNNELKFIIERRIGGGPFSPYDSIGQNMKQYVDNNTTLGQTYGYQVYAKAQEFHSGYSNDDYATAGLAAPTLNPVIDIPPNQAKVSWQNNAIISPITYTLSRWNDATNTWKDDYKTGITTTFFDDTVTFLHKYKYRVLAKDATGHTSDWSNTVEYSSGMLVQSSYDRMSAFNSQTKVLRGSDGKIHITYYNGSAIFYSYSLDGGLSFISWRAVNVDYPCDTTPDLALDGSGIPYVAFGATEPVGSSTYRVRYYVMRADQPVYPDCYYQSPLISQYTRPWPPALIFVGDDGYVTSKNIDGQIFVAGPYDPNGTPVAVIASDGYYPSIGYDGGGRIVALVYEYDPSYGYGPLRLYYRSLGNNTWSSQEVLPYSDYDGAYGAPSLWVGINELRFTVEGVCNSGQTSGLLYRRLTWPTGGSSYDLDALELISANADFSSTSTEGYSYLASKDVVLWKYLDDIWGSARRFIGGWATPLNISGSADISSYPQGITVGNSLRSSLFALWTEKIGSNYYLVRKIITPPSPYLLYAVTQTDIPEATGYNNSRRLIRDINNTLHLCFTNDDAIYHTYLMDTIWSEPVMIGEGKYPALCLAPDGKIYCTWSFHGYKKFGGLMYYVEYLLISRYDGTTWSAPGILFHTYGTFLWGVGAPSMVINDTTAYVVFKSYHGPFPNPAPGTQPPHIVVVEGPALIYGTFPLNNPVFSCTILDSIIKTQTPVDTLTYRDSLVPLLISPSVTVDMAGISHILWEGDSTMMRYYTITDAGISEDTFDAGVDFPHLTMNGDKIDLFWTANDSIRYRYGWTGTTNLSQTQTIAECESPFSSNQYLTWTKSATQNGGGLSHLYYSAIPASGTIEPVELNYSTDRILFPQIVFNSANTGNSPSLDFVWTEYSELDSLGYIYYLNLPLTEAAPKYAFNMGTETPVPVCLQRDGYMVYGSEEYQTIDYDSTELVYQLTLHSPHKKYKIRWTYYHQEPDKLKLGFSIDDILHHNRWVEPNEKVVEETWIPQACLDDNAITIRIKKLKGTIAVLSGMEIEEEEVGGGGGSQGNESQLVKPFLFENMYPNPAKRVLKIRFNSPDERKVAIKIYDVAGRLAQQVYQGKAKAGMNEFLIKPRNLAAGIYFVRVEATGYEKTQKIILLQ